MMDFQALRKKAPILKSIAHNSARREVIARYPDCKMWWFIFLEMNYLKMRSVCTKHEYMTLGMFRKSSASPKDYLTFEQLDKINDALCDPQLIDCFDDKLQFHNIMWKSGVRVPRMLGEFIAGQFRVHGQDTDKVFGLEDAGTALTLLRELGGGLFFAKTITGYGGIGAFKVAADTTAAEFVQTLGSQDFVFQEYVEQSPFIAALHPESLNTLRLTTLLDDEGTPNIVSGFFRIGRGNSVVDNASSGGICVAVDVTTGRLNTEGIVASSFGGGYFKVHPDTGRDIGGFVLPLFEECCELARRAAAVLPNPIAGWDLAICEDGPILIEGNRRPDHITDESVGGPMANRPLLKGTIFNP